MNLFELILMLKDPTTTLWLLVQYVNNCAQAIITRPFVISDEAFEGTPLAGPFIREKTKKLFEC